MTRNTLTIRAPDDWHLHLRTGEMLRLVLPFSGGIFRRALVMPNTLPDGILNAAMAEAYKQEIRQAALAGGMNHFQPLMTIKLVENYTTPDVIREAKSAGVIGAKSYPEGVTTNSFNGVRDFTNMYPVFDAMQEVGMVAEIHGEKPGDDIDCLDRELFFLDTLKTLAEKFPGLKIVMEHITTEAAVRRVLELPANVAATITAHHLVLTINDVVDKKCRPHNFCLPLAKRSSDRAALIQAAISGKGKFFFGSDSAPHVIATKECAEGCAGVFSAPVALPTLAEVFETAKALDKLEAFVSKFGAVFYGLPLNTGTVTLKKQLWHVPKVIGISDALVGSIRNTGVVPFRAGQVITWLAE